MRDAYPLRFVNVNKICETIPITQPPSNIPNRNPVTKRVILLLKYGVKICIDTSIAIGIDRSAPKIIIVIVVQFIDFIGPRRVMSLHSDWKNEPVGYLTMATKNIKDIPIYIPRHLEQTGTWLLLIKNERSFI